MSEGEEEGFRAWRALHVEHSRGMMRSGREPGASSDLASVDGRASGFYSGCNRKPLEDLKQSGGA